ncbi:MAG TPA: GAF domain-containing protein [Thermodesulfobacteriota bacterium]|nr:GAF domain-containing protein [Thermodesulfobacteriota bacterium]
MFALTADDDGKLLEFAYPLQFKGNVIPVDGKNIAGRVMISRRPYLSNNVQKDKSHIFFSWLIGGKVLPVQKMIVYPVIFAERVIAILKIVKKGPDPETAGSDFKRSDLKELDTIVNTVLTLHVVK